MSLRPQEATLLAQEFERELAGAAVQQVSTPSPTRVYLELRVPGRTVTALVCSEAGRARLSVVDKRPVNPKTPPAWQSVLRRELVGARLLDVESVEGRRVLVLHFDAERAGKRAVRALVLEYADPSGVALTTAEGRVLALSNPFRAGFRHGSTWAPPEAGPVNAQPSRLSSDFTQSRLARAAEALFETKERAEWRDAAVSPLKSKLKKLERTMEKVRVEAGRGPLALQYRDEGTLLGHNLHLVTRGATEVTLTEYSALGPVERRITLDPSRSPRQEVDWRFHQYRRLSRGVEFAQRRLEQLTAERHALEAELAQANAASPTAPPSTASKPARGADAGLLPYKSYRGHGDHPIWVGRGAAHNDALSFHLARPWHVWFHARGLPGAHVVVPLAKNAQLAAETLLDAAHLALHHSDAKGEPRGEVSYLPVKHLRKPRDAAPGAVTYSNERTLMLRLEPARLARLLATERLEPR